jgi:hypothetical protein
MRFGLYDPKRNLLNLPPKFQIRIYHILEKEIPETVGIVLIRKYKSPPENYYCNFIIPFGNILFPIKSEAWLGHFGNMYRNLKLFAVLSRRNYYIPKWKGISPNWKRSIPITRSEYFAYSPSLLGNKSRWKEGS